MLLNGFPDGNWTYFHLTGNIQTLAKYNKGKEVGAWIHYDKSGKAHS